MVICKTASTKGGTLGRHAFSSSGINAWEVDAFTACLLPLKCALASIRTTHACTLVRLQSTNDNGHTD
jgi:hypothetical protein